MRVTALAPVSPVKKIPVRTSQFPRELLEQAYREVQENKAKNKKPS